MTVDLEHLCGPFRARVLRLLADPLAHHLGLTVVSAFRSDELQAQLFADAVRRYGSPVRAGRWVAPPGRSNHGPRVDAACGTSARTHGRAVDLAVAGFAAVSGRWPAAVKSDVDNLAAGYGLRSPMKWEDWHYEPAAGFVEPASWSHAAPDPPRPAVPILEEDPDMVIVDPTTGDVWRVDRSGRVDSFDKNGEPANRWVGGLNSRPSWRAGVGPDGAVLPLGAAVAAGYWHDDPEPDDAGHRGYWITTLSPADGQFHTYHFRGSGRDRFDT